MNKIRWFFMSKYKKLLYEIETAKANKQRLVLKNGTVLDFTVDNDWQRVIRNMSGYDTNVYGEYQKYYLVTRHFPTDNRKIEIIKHDKKNGRLYLPEFTKAVMKLNVEPFKD